MTDALTAAIRAEIEPREVLERAATTAANPHMPARVIVRRHDEGIEFPWSDLQQIKDRFAGQGRWAIEMFPTRDALVDNANLRHLWVMPAGWSPPIDLREVRT